MSIEYLEKYYGVLSKLNRMKLPAYILIYGIFIGILCSGCATIVSKTSYPVTFSSNPNAAELSITDKKGNQIFKGITPAIVNLRTGAGYFTGARYVVKMSIPGYKDRIVIISHTLNGWYAGNLLFGGIIGILVIDPLTGAMWRLDRNFVSETLLKDEALNSVPSLRIMSLQDIPDEYRSHLHLIN